jgi:hypothetical protein
LRHDVVGDDRDLYIARLEGWDQALHQSRLAGADSATNADPSDAREPLAVRGHRNM